jgi:hypothetical protein
MERCSACLAEITIIGKTCRGCGTLYCYGCAVYQGLVNGSKCILCADIYGGTDIDAFAHVKSRQAIREGLQECAQCGRKRMLESEGRIIDGNWHEDKYIPEAFKYAWVCSYQCYTKLMTTSPNL